MSDVTVTCYLSKGSFVRNEVVQIAKFDDNPNPNTNSNLMPIYVSDK